MATRRQPQPFWLCAAGFCLQAARLVWAAVHLGTLYHDWGPVPPAVHELFLAAYRAEMPLTPEEEAWLPILMRWHGLDLARNNWLCFLMPLGGFAVAYVLLYRRALRRLEAWALAQGYDLIRIQRPPLRPGPFFMRAGRGWAVMQILVRRGDGGERVGWVCYPAGLPLFEPPELHSAVGWSRSCSQIIGTSWRWGLGR